MTTSISIEDVCREVKILKALSGWGISIWSNFMMHARTRTMYTLSWSIVEETKLSFISACLPSQASSLSNGRLVQLQSYEKLGDGPGDNKLTTIMMENSRKETRSFAPGDRLFLGLCIMIRQSLKQPPLPSSNVAPTNHNN